MLTSKNVKFWFNVLRLFVLFYILGALIWANLTIDFYKYPVVLAILIVAGIYIIYLIINNILFLLGFKKKNGTINGVDKQ
jgi:hypothetical protein